MWLATRRCRITAVVKIGALNIFNVTAPRESDSRPRLEVKPGGIYRLTGELMRTMATSETFSSAIL